ncbi:DUF3343 domain-containing protein [Enterococcus wangshanyuanii]|uniref:Putative Se/S carrier protein-like domain-containing protein n=1 Tax=Enterococcus wangshanyuanii TaxID=2005703 RepID=A0ABQ1NKP1_9ENTE|nr:DUF3343 domain-containing protein [Enterococcus wangshanyuanii]GGC78873.1 hypothetical protein GCM10011573_05730 [Enterococcus wangshanyuanii]
MEYLLTFQNTHYAVHSEKVLAAHKIPVSVMALPTSLGDFCGICIRLDDAFFEKGRQYLSQADLPVEEIFIIEEQNNERSYRVWND